MEGLHERPSRGVVRRSRSATGLALFVGGVVAMLLGVGCAGIAPTIPENEVERLLSMDISPSLSPDQIAHLKVLLHDDRSYRQSLQSHLEDENDVFHERLASGEKLDSPSLLAQLGLVQQLRAEQMSTILLLREQAWAVLTPEQRLWVDQHRHTGILH